MKEITIKTQKEFDKIKVDFNGYIYIKDTKESISINKSFNNAEIRVSGNATIKSVSNATIESVYGNATIEYVSNATIKYVSDNAMIKYVSDATIEYVSGNATIEYVSDNAMIKSVSGNAMILLTGLACICFLYNAKKIVAKGMNMIRQIGTQKIDIKMSKSVNFIQIKENINEKPSFNLFSKLYPVEATKTKTILYKAVHKKDNIYFSNYDKSFTYKIGEIKKIDCDKGIEKSCSQGLHLSHKMWALFFGKNWEDMAILECETDIKDIVVSKDCDGKVRTSKLKILREIPKEEYYD